MVYAAACSPAQSTNQSKSGTLALLTTNAGAIQQAAMRNSLPYNRRAMGLNVLGDYGQRPIIVVFGSRPLGRNPCVDFKSASVWRLSPEQSTGALNTCQPIGRFHLHSKCPDNGKYRNAFSKCELERHADESSFSAATLIINGNT